MQDTKKAGKIPPSVSEHLLALEDDPDADDQGSHQQEQREPGPPLLGEGQGDVHPVETRHERGRHQQQRHESEDLHDVVLVEVDDAQDRVLQVLQTLEGEVAQSPIPICEK